LRSINSHTLRIANESKMWALWGATSEGDALGY